MNQSNVHERRPLSMTRTERDTSVLMFPSGATVEMQIRGAVCWPTPPNRGEVKGYAVLGGLNVATGIVHVLEEMPFITIHHNLDENGRIKVPGLVGWLNMAWQVYGMERVYWKQDPERFEYYRNQARNCALLKPQPRFIELFWQDDTLPETQLLTLVTTDRLRQLEDAPGYAELRQWQSQPGVRASLVPAVWAQCVLVAAFMQRPWRPRT